MTLNDEQIAAATGLFQQMNEHVIATDPAVFTMFGIMLGALKASRATAADATAADATMIGVMLGALKASRATAADATAISDAELAELEQRCTGIHRTMTNGGEIMRLVTAVRAARKERDEYGAEIRRMCGTMTLEDVRTEAWHIAELDRVEATVESRTAGAIADWVSDHFDIGQNPHEEKVRIVEGIRAFLWKERP